MGERPVAIVSDAAGYVGPSLARLLARTHDLVLGDPEDGLVADLEAAGSDGRRRPRSSGPRRPGRDRALVTLAIDRFGRLDSAVAFTGAIVVGRFFARRR